MSGIGSVVVGVALKVEVIKRIGAHQSFLVIFHHRGVPFKSNTRAVF